MQKCIIISVNQHLSEKSKHGYIYSFFTCAIYTIQKSKIIIYHFFSHKMKITFCTNINFDDIDGKGLINIGLKNIKGMQNQGKAQNQG